ncbi:MAG: tetratricopeptide repeat protein [Planctomycetota bacterium]|nr:tetratricopeptide repeat protein [Planctomycetota bacterium]
MTSSPPQSDKATSAMRLVAAVLALAFFVTPYLFSFGGSSAVESKDSVVGIELAGDGLKLAMGHEALVGIQSGESGLGATLTSPWWGQMDQGQALWRPVPLLLLGVAGGLSGEPYDPEDPGDSPFPYHVLTLAFHILATLLLFELALELCRSNKVALVAAALFATLPVHTEALYDVAGIAELCAAAFGLGSWLCWLRAGDKPLANPAMLGGSLALLALACLSKESAFALPLIFFLVDAGRAGGRLNFQAALSKLPGLGAMVVVLLALFALRYAVLGTLTPDYNVANGLDNPLIFEDALTRMSNGMRMLASAVLVMFGVNPLRGDGGLSFGFSADYSATQIEVLGAFSPLNLISILLVFGSVVVAVLASKRCSMRAGLWLALLASLLLSSNVLFPIGTIFGERLLYFPSALLVLFVAMFLVRFGKAGLAAGVLLAIGGGVWSMDRAEAWEKPYELIKVTEREDAPKSAKAKFAWGLDLARSELPTLAIGKFQEAIAIYPDYAVAEGLLAVTLEANLEHEAALPHYLRDLEIQLEASDYTYEPEPHATPLGMVELLTGVTNLRAYTLDDAQGHLTWLDGLLQKGYESPHAYYNRGRTLLKLGRIDEGEAAYRRSLELEPTYLGVRYLGELLRKTGRHGEALALYDTHSRADGWYPAERAEFLLRRADAELGFDPAKTLESIDTARPLIPSMTAEQTFRFSWIWSQAMLDSMPADQGGRAEVLERVQAELGGAFNRYNEANDLTYSARYALVNIFVETGNFDELVDTAEEMLNYRPAPVLRTRLAAAYGALGETDKAIDNWRGAAAELVNEDGTPIDRESLLAARRGLLQSLAAAGRTSEVPAAFAEWHALVGGQDPWTLSLEADWHAGQGDLGSAVERAQELASGYPEIAEAPGLVTQLETWQAGADFAANFGLCSHLIGWGNYTGALPIGQKALGLAASDQNRAEAMGLIANCLVRLERPDEALAVLDDALALPLPQAFKDRIQQTRDAVAAPAGE